MDIPLSGLQRIKYDSIVVTSYLKREAMRQTLLTQGIDEKNIRTIFKIHG